MRLLNLWACIAGLTLCGCNQTDSKDEREITTLIRRVLNLADSPIGGILLPPEVKDKKGKFFIGIDLAKHKQNLQKIRVTNLFAAEFINDYNQLILALDDGLRKGSYGPWLVGDNPNFSFASGVSPWCSCQDVPYDKPNPYDSVEVEVVSLNGREGELNWKWGGIGPGYDSAWKNFKYKFRVVKEDGQWKIAYLEGYDFERGVAKNF